MFYKVFELFLQLDNGNKITLATFSDKQVAQEHMQDLQSVYTNIKLGELSYD